MSDAVADAEATSEGPVAEDAAPVGMPAGPMGPGGPMSMPTPEQMLQVLRQRRTPLKIQVLRAVLAVGVVAGLAVAPVITLAAIGAVATGVAAVGTVQAGRGWRQRRSFIKQLKKAVEERKAPTDGEEGPEAPEATGPEAPSAAAPGAPDAAAPEAPSAATLEAPKRTLKHLTPEMAHRVRVEIATERFWKGQQAEAQAYRTQMDRIVNARTLNEAAALASEALAGFNDKAPRCRENITYRWALHEISKKQFIDSAAKAKTFAAQSMALYAGGVSVAETGTKPPAGPGAGVPYPVAAAPTAAAPAVPESAAAVGGRAAAGARLAAAARSAAPRRAASGPELGG